MPFAMAYVGAIRVSRPQQDLLSLFVERTDWVYAGVHKDAEFIDMHKGKVSSQAM
jgi:hypothetical protein